MFEISDTRKRRSKVEGIIDYLYSNNCGTWCQGITAAVWKMLDGLKMDIMKIGRLIPQS